MSIVRRPRGPRHPARVRTILAGVVLLGAVGSCVLPKPQLPSIGSTTHARGAAVVALGMSRAEAAASPSLAPALPGGTR